MKSTVKTEHVDKTIPDLRARGRYLTDRYEDFEWDDETSASDPKGRWQGGSDCYTRIYRCRVPVGLAAKAEASGDDALLHEWVERNNDKPIWLD